MGTSPTSFGNMSKRVRLSALLARTGLPREPPTRSRPKYLRAVAVLRWCLRNKALYDALPRRRSESRLRARSSAAFPRVVEVDCGFVLIVPGCFARALGFRLEFMGAPPRTSIGNPEGVCYYLLY